MKHMCTCTRKKLIDYIALKVTGILYQALNNYLYLPRVFRVSYYINVL